MAKFLDSNGLLYIWGKITAALGGKVDKETGKVLSSNDLTNELKANYDAAYNFSKNTKIPSISTDIDADAQSDTMTASPKAVKNYVDKTVGEVDLSDMLEKDGNGSKLTVDFTAAESFADIVSSESLSTTLGKLKKWFSMRGVANGFATLDSDGIVPSAQLPSYVDDVIELLTIDDTAPSATLTDGDKYYAPSLKLIYTYGGGAWNNGKTPEGGKIYLALDSNNSYRWSGSTMLSIGSGELSAITNEEIDTLLAV